MKKLAVLLYGARAGTVTQMPAGTLVFNYDAQWIEKGPGIPLSLSMPMTTAIFPDLIISNFLWGLLPENEKIINEIARMGEPTSPRNVLGLLAKVGEDCAGALQIVPDERIKSLMDDTNVEWLSEKDVGDRIRSVKNMNAMAPSSIVWKHGRFSLAGAQAKFALTQHVETGIFGQATGSVPTTHIFKPPIPGLTGQVENEHFCLSLASLLGLPSSASKVQIFDGEPVIVVKRYDRFTDKNGDIRRVHQEDMCQALGISPFQKYQSDKGPSAKQIVNTVLAASNQPEIDTSVFTRALMLNFLICGTDAHAKNYSILFGKYGKHRLAPLYDINSFLPYESDDRSKLAMSIGGHYEVNRIMPRHWEKFAGEINVPYGQIESDLMNMVKALPDLAVQVAASCRTDGLKHEIFDTLINRISTRCKKSHLRFSSIREIKGRRDAVGDAGLARHLRQVEQQIVVIQHVRHIGPFQNGLAGELGSVVGDDAGGLPTGLQLGGEFKAHEAGTWKLEGEYGGPYPLTQEP